MSFIGARKGVLNARYIRVYILKVKTATIVKIANQNEFGGSLQYDKKILSSEVLS